MNIDKLKNRFVAGAWLTDVKHYFSKINEIIDYLNGIGKSGDGSYKVYIALLNQTGEDAPVATVLDNTLGNIVWTRDGKGEYYGTLTGAFADISKIFIPNPYIFIGTKGSIYTGINNADSLFVSTEAWTDWNASIGSDGILSLLNNIPIEIRVYN